MQQILAVILFALTLTGCDTGTVGSQQKAALTAVTNGALLIDVRSAEEVKSGMLGGAVNISHEGILAGVTALNVGKDQPIVVYCRSGNRSGKAEQALKAAGFTNVINGGAYVDLKATQMAMKDSADACTENC